MHLRSCHTLSERLPTNLEQQPNILCSDNEALADVDDGTLTEDDDTLTGNDELDLKETYMRFVSYLQSKPCIALNTIQDVARTFKEVVTDIADFASERVREVCAANRIPLAHPSVTQPLRDVGDLPNQLDDVSTEYKQLQYLVKKGLYIEPDQIVLGLRQEKRYNSKSGVMESVYVEDTFQAVSLIKLLTQILESPGVGKFMSAENSEDGYISQFRDTNTYKNHPVFSKHPDALQIHLFVDAFETVNALGSHTSVRKLEGLYMQLQNFPCERMSSTNSIFMLGLWFAQDVKTYGYEKLLARIISEIKLLESDEGVSVKLNGVDNVLRGCLVYFSGDNRGLKSLFGFVESFSAIKFCRFREAKKEEIQENFLEANFLMRTATSYDGSANLADTNHSDYGVRATGIKKPYPLNSLKFFHVTENFICDAMHDLFEGVIPMELKLVLQKIIEDEKLLTLEDLRQAIDQFNYSSSDRNSRPPCPSSIGALHLKAAEAWCLLRNLPCMIGHKIPRDEPHWNLLLLLLDITNIVMARGVTEGLCDFLAALIEDHHVLFKQLFPIVRLLPKHHFLVHYPMCMKKSGPCYKYWCMRFEANHCAFKRTVHSTHCFKNICKTLAKRSQLKLANVLVSQQLFMHRNDVGTCEASTVNQFEEPLSLALRNIGLCQTDEVYSLSWVKIGHYTLHRRDVLVYGTQDGTPTVGRIMRVVSISSDIYVILQQVQITHFDSHFRGYVCSEESDQFICIRLLDVVDFHPLQNEIQTVVYEDTQLHILNCRYLIV